MNNPAVVEAAVNNAQPVTTSEDESNDDFGLDFPGLVQAPLLNEEGLLDDPVASGGDASFYGDSDEEDEDDEDDEESEGGED